MSALITRPSADSDLLISLASSRRSPVAPVLDVISLPARSTRKSLPTLAVRSERLFWTTVAMRQAWEREDSAFMRVEDCV